jgi:hypothetical protein
VLVRGGEHLVAAATAAQEPRWHRRP